MGGSSAAWHPGAADRGVASSRGGRPRDESLTPMPAHYSDRARHQALSRRRRPGRRLLRHRAGRAARHRRRERRRQIDADEGPLRRHPRLRGRSSCCAAQPVRFAGTRDAEAAGIGIIHQELNLVEDLSAAANIFLGREKRTRLGLLDDRAMERAAADLLTQLECHVSPRQPVRELRVGDQQLVEIAKALSLETDILIMDEPTSALTESEVARLFRVIDRLRQRGVTILYISHKMDEVFRLADRITVLRDGRLIRTLRRADTGPREVTHLMVGREIEAVHLGTGRQPGDVVLEVRGLSLPWTGHARAWRLKDISFTPAPRRNPRHRRPDGSRADGTARMPVRLQRRAAARHDPAGRPAGALRPPRGGDAGRHRAGDGGPQAPGAVRQPRRGREHHASARCARRRRAEWCGGAASGGWPREWCATWGSRRPAPRWRSPA